MKMRKGEIEALSIWGLAIGTFFIDLFLALSNSNFRALIESSFIGTAAGFASRVFFIGAALSFVTSMVALISIPLRKE